MPAGWLLAAGFTGVITLILLGRLSCTWGALILDLDYLHCTMVNGPGQVRWRDVLEVTPVLKSSIRIQLENHMFLLVHVPEDDREWLVQIMEQLILHHQDLHGVFPDSDSISPTLSETTETRHGRPQQSNRYAAFVAERDQVFAAMPNDMTDADRQREFTEFLRWRNIRS